VTRWKVARLPKKEAGDGRNRSLRSVLPRSDTQLCGHRSQRHGSQRRLSMKSAICHYPASYATGSCPSYYYLAKSTFQQVVTLFWTVAYCPHPWIYSGILFMTWPSSAILIEGYPVSVRIMYGLTGVFLLSLHVMNCIMHVWRLKLIRQCLHLRSLSQRFSFW